MLKIHSIVLSNSLSFSNLSAFSLFRQCRLSDTFVYSTSFPSIYLVPSYNYLSTIDQSSFSFSTSVHTHVFGLDVRSVLSFVRQFSQNSQFLCCVWTNKQLLILMTDAHPANTTICIIKKFVDYYKNSPFSAPFFSPLLFDATVIFFEYPAIRLRPCAAANFSCRFRRCQLIFFIRRVRVFQNL